MQALQAVIFDFDGVIANSEPLHLRAFQETLAARELSLTPAEYYERYLGYDDVGAFGHFFADRALALDPAGIQALVADKEARMQALMAGSAVLYPGAAAFIRACAGHVPIAIASGATRHEIEEILQSAGLAGAFPVIVAAGETPEGKPSPQPYRRAFDLLQQRAGTVRDTARCVAIEDSHWGMASALGAGLRCVGLTTSYAAEALPHAELLAGGLGELTIEMLDTLAARPLV